MNPSVDERPGQLPDAAQPPVPAVAVVCGTARFRAPNLDRLANTFGADIAWRAACFEQGIANAAAGTVGPFSVGIKDGLGRTSIAVDRFAVHTLCYCVTNGELRFAQRANALADARTEIDPQAIFDYLFFHAIPSPRTIYRGIYRLPPGHYAVFDKGHLQLAPYWEPGTCFGPESSPADLRQELLRLLHQAVGRQLDVDTPACTLNGCTDSASVASIIAALSGQPVRTYGVGFEASGHDETERTRLAAKHLGTTHQQHRICADDLVRSISTLASHYDQPFGSSLALLAYYGASMARADGVKRLLVSEGGDALFGRPLRHPTPHSLGWFGALPAMQRQYSGKAAPVRETKPYREQNPVAQSEQLSLYTLLNRLGMERVFAPDFLHLVNPAVVSSQPWQIWQAPRTEGLAPQENHVPMAYGISSLASVEAGFALLDQDLLDFWLSLPTKHRHRGQPVDGLFKESLRHLLPQPLSGKNKPIPGFPFGQWLCQHAGLRKLATDSLHAVAERGIVRRDFIHALLGQALQQHPAYYGEMAWLLVVLEYWLRAHAPLYRVQA